MKLLFFCKRRPMGRDLLTSPYGRFYHLPRLLARKGYKVTILLCSYKLEPDESVFYDDDGISWYSVSLASLNPLRYYLKALQLVRGIRPDWIVGFSDTYYGILAQYMASRFGSRSLIDAYDNYESYMSWCKPLHSLWQHALVCADLVTAAGPQLADLMGRHRLDKPTMVLPMAADPIGFKPLNKIKCRRELGLPADKQLIGYCGAIYANRGIDLLFDAYKILMREHKNIELVMSGRKGPGVSMPDGVRWLGYLPNEQVPVLLNSMDVLTVINKLSAFGNYSYPIKLYEAMCCQVPVVATATSSTKWILNGFPDFLATTNDSVDLSKKIIKAMQYEKFDYGHQQGWDNEAIILERALKDISQSN